MKRRHSLSGRLLGLFLLTGLALVLVVRGGFRLAAEGDFRELAGPHIGEYVRHLLQEVGNPPDPDKAAALAHHLPVEIQILGTETAWSSAVEPTQWQEDRLHAHDLPGGQPVLAGREGGRFLVVAPVGDYRVVLVSERWRSPERVPWVGALTIVGVLGVLALAYHAIRRLFRPLDGIRAGLTRIGGGDLEHRIEVRRRDELGELADSVNAMADDIRGLLEAKRQLLLAISHELRSPIARARVNLALLPEGPNRAAVDEDLGVMGNLVGELLETERLNTRHAALNIGAEDPAELVREVIARHFPQTGIRTMLEEGVYLALDPARIRLLVRNLLDNAVRHTPEGAQPPDIRVCVDDEGWFMEVIDRGPGIPAEHLPHITDPFYRADPSRSRETGGYGLGLHLCKAICEAHGGRLTIGSGIGGTRVRCRFPVAG